MPNEEKTYIGNGKEINSQYVVFTGSICAESIPKEAWKLHQKSGKHYLNFIIGLSKKAQYGNTHYIALAKAKKAIPDFSEPLPKTEEKPWNNAVPTGEFESDKQEESETIF